MHAYVTMMSVLPLEVGLGVVIATGSTMLHRLDTS